MTRRITAALAGVLLAACAACRSPEARVVARDAWARPTLGASAEDTAAPAPPGVVYLVLANQGSRADRLVGAETEVASTVEIHETRVEGERMRMVHLTDGVEIPAGGEVSLRPGGLHLMLIGLVRHLRAGESFPLALRFATSPPLTVQVDVRGS